MQSNPDPAQSELALQLPPAARFTRPHGLLPAIGHSPEQNPVHWKNRCNDCTMTGAMTVQVVNKTKITGIHFKHNCVPRAEKQS